MTTKEITCNYYLSPFSSYGGKLIFNKNEMNYTSPHFKKIGINTVSINYKDVKEIKRFKAIYSLLNFILIPTGIFLIMKDGTIHTFSTFKRKSVVNLIKERI